MDHFTFENELIIKYLKELKLSIMRDMLSDTITEAESKGWDHRRFLQALLQQEVEQRIENRKYTRIKRANFPQLKYLQELVREELPADGRELLPELETLRFLSDKSPRNIIMYGNPGTGKTHIAIGLGIKACLEGYNVYFTSIPHLLTQIREAKSNKTLQLLQARFVKYDLVICDEMGYVALDKESAEMLFNLISLRTGGVKSTSVTTNLPFTRWEEIIKDKVLCSALCDRLCHKAYLVNMTGQSYRVKETQQMLKNKEY